MVPKVIIFIHLLAAMIWTGGHLILALGFLPSALKKNDFSIIAQFEERYEKIGIPSLLILVVTGIYMAAVYAPSFFDWDLGDHYTRHIALKLLLLLITVGLAIHARFFLIPKKKLRPLAWHIIGVTITAVLFVLVGFSARSGGIL
ncbi:MAG: CopD family protein [Allomuricauda sp.]